MQGVVGTNKCGSVRGGRLIAKRRAYNGWAKNVQNTGVEPDKCDGHKQM